MVLPVKIGPTLPARGAADVLRSRPVADVLPVMLAGPWCCRRAALPVNSRPVAHAPGRSLGKRCRPVVLPVKIGPTLPARGAADVLRSRPVADVPAFRPRGAAGQLPAGCRAAGYLTVGGSGLRPNRGKSWPERHAMACSRAGSPAARRQPAAVDGRRSGRVACRWPPGSGLRLTFSIPVPIPAVAALPAAYKRAADAMPTLPTSHSCRDTSPSCRPLSSSSIADKLPAGRAPDHTSIIWHSAAGSPARSSGGPCRAVRPAAWSSGTVAGSGGLAAVLAFPVGKIDGPAAGYPAAGSGGLVGGPVFPVGKIGPGAVAGFGGWPGLEAARRWPQSAQARWYRALPVLTPLRLGPG